MQTGVIGEAQHDYDLNLLAFIFGMPGGEKFYSLLSKAKSTGDFTDFLTAYQPEAAKAAHETRLEQISKTGGIF